MKYKLVCCDLDGTLVDWDGKIPAENKRAIEQLKEEGIIFAICTGRAHNAARLIAKLLEINPYLISVCGGIVESDKEGDFLRYDAFAPSDLKEFLEMGRLYNAGSVNYNYLEGILHTAAHENYEYCMYQDLNAQGRAAGILEENLVEMLVDPTGTMQENFDRPVCKIGIWMNNAEDQKKLYQYALEKKMDQRYELTSGMAENIEIMPKGVTKWSGIEKIMQRHGIKPEEVVCIGDSMNDADMIIHAGLGVAMDNSSDEVKALADLVTDDNVNAGVAKVIFEHVLV